MKRNSTEQLMKRVLNEGKSGVMNQIKHLHSIITGYQLLTYHYLPKEVKAECFYSHTLSFNCFEKLNDHSAVLMKQSASTKQPALMKQSASAEDFFWVSNWASYTLLLLWQWGHCHFLFLSALLRIIHEYRGSGVILVVWLGVLG